MSLRNKQDLISLMDRAGSGILKCMHCGVCSGSCPSGRHTSLNVRRLLKKARNDAGVLSDDSLWMCTTCYNCQERCPRGIGIVDAIFEMRALAVREGIIYPEHRKVGELLLEHGHAVPIDEENMAKRKALGLDPLPPTVHSFPEGLAEVKKLMASCRFDELMSEK
ncbi:MAG: CoB--CoM heterodisulfide reductase subunit C [Halobacteriota archaeon]